MTVLVRKLSIVLKQPVLKDLLVRELSSYNYVYLSMICIFIICFVEVDENLVEPKERKRKKKKLKHEHEG